MENEEHKKYGMVEIIAGSLFFGACEFLSFLPPVKWFANACKLYLKKSKGGLNLSAMKILGDFGLSTIPGGLLGQFLWDVLKTNHPELAKVAGKAAGTAIGAAVGGPAGAKVGGAVGEVAGGGTIKGAVTGAIASPKA